jgi:hypothetical protein
LPIWLPSILVCQLNTPSLPFPWGEGDEEPLGKVK